LAETLTVPARLRSVRWERRLWPAGEPQILVPAHQQTATATAAQELGMMRERTARPLLRQ